MKGALLILFTSIAVAFGQETERKSCVRFLALGDLPPHREKVVDGERVRITKPFELPPEEIFIQTHNETFATSSLLLRRLTPRFGIQGEEARVFLKKDGESELQSWVNVPLLNSGQHLVVLTKGERPDWKEVEPYVFDDSVEAFPPGTMRFANTSRADVAIRIGKEKAFLVMSGKVVIKKSPEDLLPVAMAIKNQAGAWKKIFENELAVVGKGARGSWFAYDGDRSGRPAKLHHYLERIESGGLPEREGNLVASGLVDGAEGDRKAGSRKQLNGKVEQDGTRGEVTIAEEGIIGGGGRGLASLRGTESKGKKVEIGVHRERGAEAAEVLSKVRFDTTLALVVLAVFVGLIIRWGMRWDAIARK